MPSDYYSMHGLSHSQLKNIAKSPARFRWELDHPKGKSAALDLGSLVHAMVLEPHTVAEEFVRVPKVDRRTKAGKEAWASFQEEAGDKTTIPDDDWATAEGMASSVLVHPVAGELIENARDLTKVEREYFWNDPRGFTRKSKVDAEFTGEIAGLRNPIIDLKTTLDASRGFRFSIKKYCYHTQGAYYRDAIRSHHGDPGGFIIIAVEKAPPFEIGMFVFDDEALDRSKQVLESWLDLYDRCRLSDTWPGNDELVHVEVSDWLLKEAGIGTDEE